MARQKFIHNSESFYHITSRTNSREWFDIPLDEVWQYFQEQLHFHHHGFGAQIYAFVLMQNHFHMIARYPQNNISTAMGYLLKETSRSIAKSSQRMNHIYKGRFHRCEIFSYHYFMTAYKYVYQNPVRAGIVSRAEEYKFSTLNGLLGANHLLIPLQPDSILFSEFHTLDSTLDWINTLPNQQHAEFVRTALKKPRYKYALLDNGQPNPLELALY